MLLTVLTRISLAKAVASAAGASLITTLAVVIEPPPFGNIWFDMMSGAVVLFLLQCFAYSLEKPHKESSDWYKSFYRFTNAAFGVRAVLSRGNREILDKIAEEEDERSRRSAA